MKKPAAPTVPMRARPPPPGSVPATPEGPPAPPPLGVEETARSREGSLLKEGFNALVGLVVGSDSSPKWSPPRPVATPSHNSADDGLFAASQADFGSDEGFRLSAPVIKTAPPRKAPPPMVVVVPPRGSRSDRSRESYGSSGANKSGDGDGPQAEAAESPSLLEPSMCRIATCVVMFRVVVVRVHVSC